MQIITVYEDSVAFNNIRGKEQVVIQIINDVIYANGPKFEAKVTIKFFRWIHDKTFSCHFLRPLDNVRWAWWLYKTIIFQAWILNQTYMGMA